MPSLLIHMCGGGSLNPAIKDYLQAELPNTRVISIDEPGVPSASMKAVSFAIRGLEAALGRPLAVPINSYTRTRNWITGKLLPERNSES